MQNTHHHPSSMNPALRIRISTEPSADGDVVVYRVFGCEVFRSFINEHVPELLLDTDGDGTELGLSLLYGSFGQPTSVYGHAVDLQDDLDRFLNTYISIISVELCLRLVMYRMLEQRVSPHSFTPHTEGIREAMDRLQTTFEHLPIISLMPGLRAKVTLNGLDLLNYVLKAYVRFNRKAFKEGFSREERLEIALLMRLATERLGLRNIHEQGSLTDLLLKTADKIGATDYEKPVIVRGWPTNSVYYREIRDPRFRRFRN